jgi:hypothetical protein
VESPPDRNQHTYASAGDFTVTLTVSDGRRDELAQTHVDRPVRGSNDRDRLPGVRDTDPGHNRDGGRNRDREQWRGGLGQRCAGSRADRARSNSLPSFRSTEGTNSLTAVVTDAQQHRTGVGRSDA